MRRSVVVVVAGLLAGCSTSAADVTTDSGPVAEEAAAVDDVAATPAAADGGEETAAERPTPLGTCPDPGRLTVPTEVHAGEDLEASRTTVAPRLFWLDAHDGDVVVSDFDAGLHHVVDGQVTAVPHDLSGAGLVLRFGDQVWVSDFHGSQPDRLATLDLETGAVLDERPVMFDFPYFWGDGVMGGTTSGGLAWFDVASGATAEAEIDGGPLGALPVGGYVMVLVAGGPEGHHFQALDAATGELVHRGAPEEALRMGYMAALGDDCLVVAARATADVPTELQLVEVPSGVVAAVHEIPMMSDFYNLITVGETVWASGFAAGQPRVLRIDLATGVVAPPVEWPRAGQPHLAVDGAHAWFTHGTDLVAIPFDYADTN